MKIPVDLKSLQSEGDLQSFIMKMLDQVKQAATSRERSDLYTADNGVKSEELALINTI